MKYYLIHRVQPKENLDSYNLGPTIIRKFLIDTEFITIKISFTHS